MNTKIKNEPGEDTHHIADFTKYEKMQTVVATLVRSADTKWDWLKKQVATNSNKWAPRSADSLRD